jgi:spartin
VQNVVETTYKKGVEPAVDLYRAANEGRRQSIEALFGYEEKPALPSPSPQPQTSEKAQLTSGLPLPPRKPSPLQSDAIGMKIDVPSKTDTLLAQEQARDDTEADAAESDAPPAYSDIPISQSVPIAPKPAIAGVAPDRQAASTPPKKRPFLNRLLLAGEVVLTSLEATAQDLINSGTGAASSVAGHKLGPEAGRATALLGGSVRNVAVVYIDVRGVGRRALLKGTAKGFVKARLASGEEVKLQGDGEKVGGIEVEEGQVERVGEGIVVGMTEVQKVEQPAESEPTQSAGAVGPDEKAALAKV